MDNPADPMSQPPLSQADISLLRSFISRLPNIAAAGEGQQPGPGNNTPMIPAPPPFASSTQQPLTAPIASHPQQITPYLPAHLRSATLNTGHPVRSGPSQAILHPHNPAHPQFQGIQSLGTGVTRQLVNQQRLASASATILRQPALQARNSRRGRRPGSANIHPPGIPPIPTMDNALVTHDDGSVSLKICAKVYPPPENVNSDLVLYTNYSESFNATLESYFLIHDYEIQPSSTLANVISKIVEDMSSCPMEYRFSTRFPEGIVRHEALPIRVLALTNRGRSRPRTGQIYLQRTAVSGTTPISELFANRNFYANPRLCLENDRFVLHFVVVHHPFSAMLPPTGNATERRRHKCISYRIYRQFPYDGYIGPEDLGSTDPYDTSGGESSSEESTDNESDNSPTPQNRLQGLQQPQMSQLRRQVPASYSAIRNLNKGLVSIPRQQSTVRQPSTIALPQASTPGDSLLISRYLPSTIWESNWSPPASPRRHLIEDLTTVEDVGRYVYNTISPQHPRLSIRGKNVQELATRFHSALTSAAMSKDFTPLFSAEREFIVENSDGSIRSLGAGVEAEVLYLAFEQLQATPGQWFYPRVDNTSSITTMHTFASSSSISTARLEGMHSFGALTALLLIHGIPPLPLSPIFLQWIVYDCNLKALHSDLISEWHPELFTTIKRWMDIGATGSLASFQSHFSTWHDAQIGLYQHRNEASHKAFAAEMLYRAVIGSEPPNHPEIQEFIAGFRLPCQHFPDFDFTHVLKSFSGGPEIFLSLVWTSQIKSFNDLSPYIRFRPAPSTLTDEAFSQIGDGDTTLQEIVSRFLKSSGIPCPKLFDEAKMHFSDLINFDKIDDSSFRTRMFCWAATGCPSMAPDSGDISVYLVNDNDAHYSQPAFREAMLREGRISFKTCSRQVRIPASHFAVLSIRSYSEMTEPTSLENAIEHWLLCEILNAIGQHSVL